MLVPLMLSLAVLAGSAPNTLGVEAADTACIARFDLVPADGRRSPLDSVSFRVKGSPVKVCYGRPSARGRTMIGGAAVPYGSIWRTGANEPTMIHTTAPLSVAGIDIPAGTYSLYTVPGEQTWAIIVNRSFSQWGQEGEYTPEVQAQEVGRAQVPSERTTEQVETFTIRAEPQPDGSATLILEWERTRVRVPVGGG